MAAEEITGNRDLKYSHWHRSSSGHLSDKCKCLNIDFLEIRNDKPVAFIEITESQHSLSSYPLKWKYYHSRILTKLTELTKIPSYIVVHNKELTEFKIFYALPGNISVVLNEKEYAEWLENIDKHTMRQFLTKINKSGCQAMATCSKA